MTVGKVYDGPLDLLLDLIRKQDIDIYDIPIAQITAQYLAYVERIKHLDVDVAAEFIYMASLLIHIKSQMLLPRDPDAPATAGPARRAGQPPARARALQGRSPDAAAEAADRGGGAQQSGAAGSSATRRAPSRRLAADVIDLVKTFQRILERAKSRPVLAFDEETVTVAQMIEYVRRRLMVEDRPVRLKQLLRHLRTRQALVCAFLAILEMVRLQAVLCRQDAIFGEVVLKKHVNFDAITLDTSAVQDDWQ